MKSLEQQINYADPIDVLFLSIFQSSELEKYRISNPNEGNPQEQCQNAYINQNVEAHLTEGAAMRQCHNIIQSDIDKYFDRKSIFLFKEEFHYKMLLCSYKLKADKRRDCSVSRVRFLLIFYLGLYFNSIFVDFRFFEKN